MKEKWLMKLQLILIQQHTNPHSHTDPPPTHTMLASHQPSTHTPNQRHNQAKAASLAPHREDPGSSTHVSLCDLVPLVGVVQRVDRQVRDGDGGGGGEGDQENQDARPVLQGEVQFVGPLPGQGGQIYGAPEHTQKHTCSYTRSK